MTGKKRRYSLLMTLPYGWKLHERKNSVGSGFPDETPCRRMPVCSLFFNRPERLLVDERHKNTFTSVFFRL